MTLEPQLEHRGRAGVKRDVSRVRIESWVILMARAGLYCISVSNCRGLKNHWDVSGGDACGKCIPRYPATRLTVLLPSEVIYPGTRVRDGFEIETLLLRKLAHARLRHDRV